MRGKFSVSFPVKNEWTDPKVGPLWPHDSTDVLYGREVGALKGSGKLHERTLGI